MKILIVGIFIFLISFLAHVLIWRNSNIKKTPLNIAKIFIGLYIFILILLVSASILKINLFFDDVFSIMHSYVLAAALFCAYLLSYPGIESDSPSNIILLNIEKSGNAGMAESELKQIVTDDLLTKERLSGLIRDGHVINKEGLYFITEKGIRFLKIFKIIKIVFKIEVFKG